ncbi:hypothetical protein MasN3_21930 [Massilia varians]|uniref:Uncharacterized protein n=1 Tax=Massilia varians TaxID=457921 RepID=A0ABN6TFG5_9BURK|nr:hypothetical protein [Massilia varians]BDT58699.1 hypothetical protein MasN3_21930 [Massilia varians]
MRPNLMSPRRTATSGEDSILAMLEREPARKRGAKPSGIRLAGYGASALLALALTGALVWMAANNDGLRPDVQETVLADTAHAPQRSGAADSPAAAASILQVAMAPAAQPGGAAVIVDQPAPAEAVPPLRLLKPAPGKPVPEPPAPPARSSTPPVPATAVAARPVAKPSLPTRAAAPAPDDTRPLNRAAAPAKPRQAALAKNTVKPAPAKAQRGVNPARSADAPVDADVALISAVIVHANGHAPEGSQMTELLCPNNACQSRPAGK